jgi:hypothetical protein
VRPVEMLDDWLSRIKTNSANSRHGIRRKSRALCGQPDLPRVE